MLHSTSQTPLSIMTSILLMYPKSQTPSIATSTILSHSAQNPLVKSLSYFTLPSRRLCCRWPRVLLRD
ncbi:hypothetical protein O3M35_009464 [Rhynocoris fuscipes]|uniref:Uncharacterized protein n=1 Tax=Rhynocoris fuscipes TaxID=488301 RepID=A0AAW1DAK3_9HEMI